jgi:hypothetical protein
MKAIAIAVLVTAAVGCATTPVPADKYARARSGIHSAEVMAAEKVPNAALHLRLAKENLDKAKGLLKDGENEEASFWLLRAEADADAAMNLAREAWAKQDAAQTIQQVQQMKAQLEVPRS